MTMEYGSIELEIHVEASPEVVFEVISSPEHLQEWWPDEAVLVLTCDGSGDRLSATVSVGKRGDLQ